MDKEKVQKTDWSKISMGIAVAIVFVMQQYHAMKLNEVKATVVPRHEIQKHTDRIMDRGEIIQSLKMINDRLNAMEAKDGS